MLPNYVPRAEILLLFLFLSVLVTTNARKSHHIHEPHKQQDELSNHLSNDDDDAAPKRNHPDLPDDLTPAESITAQQQLFHATSPTSHEILASGWPATSPMWPSLDIAEEDLQKGEQATPDGKDGQTTTMSRKLVNPVEPFIFADKPSKQDYSLLLSLNRSFIDSLMSSKKQQVDKNLSVQLSFEYFLNHEPKVAALPGIRIEVDRKEFDYLEPTTGGGGDKSVAKSTKAAKIKMWTRHSRRIALGDAQQLDKPDWLKLSLVNRESPSLVAIRRLRVEFSLSGAGDTVAVAPPPTNAEDQVVQPAQPSVPPADSPALPASPEATPPHAAPPSSSSDTSAVPPAPPSPQQPPANQGATSPGELSPPESAPPAPPPPERGGGRLSSPPGGSAPYAPDAEQLDPSQAGQLEPPGGQLPELGSNDQVASASEVLASTIKPVAPKKREGGFISNILGRRRKRQASTTGDDASASTKKQASSDGDTLAVLTCYSSDACDQWKAEPSAGQIQWSLARAPPSTSAITLGYYYVSNRHNYGDASRALYLWLNQTESATIVDQAADHCVDLALYVTEQTRLKLYRAVRRATNESSVLSDESFGIENNSGSQVATETGSGMWQKSSLLISWAPTTIYRSSGGEGGGAAERFHLNGGSQMAATNQSGWTLETLCFGDFFEREHRCGLGECALAFEMSNDDDSSSTSSLAAHGDDAGQQQQQASGDAAAAENLGENDAAAPTGAGRTRQRADEQVVGVALLRQYATSVPNRQTRPPKWLETWARQEVEPTDNWRFYPKLDYTIQGDNLSLVNLYDGARYSIQSDWLQSGAHLDFGASLLIEILDGEDLLTGAGNTSSAQSDDKFQQRDGGNLLFAATAPTDTPLFSLKITRRIVSQRSFETLHALNSSIDWYEHYNNSTKLALFNMSLPNLSELMVVQAPEKDDATPQAWPTTSLFKMIIDIVLDCHWQQQPTAETSKTSGVASSDATTASSEANHQPAAQPRFRLMLANVSLADRCFPSPCQFGTCQQNGTAPDDWQCQCDAQHRGRRCEFGRWCQLAHVAPPATNQLQLLPSSGGGNAGASPLNNQQQQQSQKIKLDNNFQLVILKSLKQKQESAAGGTQGQQAVQSAPQQQNKQASAPNTGQSSGNSVARVTGKEFCQRKLGAGSKCTEIDLPLNDRLYFDENETFTCSCQDDYYLSDDRKCRQAHPCHSIVCPSIGQICDETKPFNRTQPCHCNEKQDWYPADIISGGSNNNGAASTSQQQTDHRDVKCIRRQCHDKRRDCGFDAHVCLPTVPGERPICKCGPKFSLKQNDKGQKYCQSTACVLPTLNDCQHICTPVNDSADLQRPYTCSCHEGYSLDKDGHTCRPKQANANNNNNNNKINNSNKGPQCKPQCNSRTQICTELGCKCRQGYVPEGEIIVQISSLLTPSSQGRSLATTSGGNTTHGLVNYVQSVRCLNVCSLSYAENKFEFERIESVCPLGLCEPATFNCRCFDPNSSALVHTKYEPIWAGGEHNGTTDDSTTSEKSTTITQEDDNNEFVSADGLTDSEGDTNAANTAERHNHRRKRLSPLCHLKRVCQLTSASYQLCRARGAICVPDYTKPAMFDCICPPSSEKRTIGAAGDFQCEPRCSSVRQECLKKQAVCRPIDKEAVRCDCLPGMMLDKHDERCYLAHYSYAMNIIIVNKYYEPESRFHKLAPSHESHLNSSISQDSSHSESSPPSLSSSSLSQAELANEALHQLVPQFLQTTKSQRSPSSASSSMFITDYNQCNLTALLPKSILEDPYEHDMGTFLQYMDQCNEKIHQNARTYSLNSKLSEDLRQSMRQHLRDFTVTTNNSLCQELPGAAGAADQISYLNCTIFLQSMEPIEEATINHVFTNCDKHGADERFCWIKPRLLLTKMSNNNNVRLPPPPNDEPQNGPSTSGSSSSSGNPFAFRQIIPCEVNKFCGEDAHSLRLDDKTSLCSCKCPPDIEMIDLKELEPRSRALVPLIPQATGGASDSQQQQHSHNSIWLPPAASSGTLATGSRVYGAIKEICAPRNHCGVNSTYCSFKIGSVCHYDIRTGSRCNCVYPSYENNEGRCVEITFSQLNNTLIVIIIMVGTCLVVSLAINLYALARSKHGLFGHRSKQYPLSEFSTSTRHHSSATAAGHRAGISHRHPDDDDNDDDENDAISLSNRRHFSGGNNNSAAGGRHHGRSHHQSAMNRSTGMPNLAFDPND